ncbi:MAG: hypothetical protein NTW87_08630 [Planctomycetota bacterium]|nr:hypothetical protein [Planctomycetota bacterium]
MLQGTQSREASTKAIPSSVTLHPSSPIVHVKHRPRSDIAAAPARFDKDLLGGVVVITGRAMKIPQDTWDDELYSHEPPGAYSVRFKAVPYCAWDNRAPGEMLVWLREV